VASAVLRRLFRREPPVNVPYEFFLVEGAKMSSSRGVGASAKEISDLLPPRVLKFLMLSRRPNQQVNFSPEKQTITNLFNQFDRTRQQALGGDDDARTLLELCGDAPVVHSALDFGLVATFLQVPRADLYAEAAKRKGAPLDDAERADLAERLAAARYWLDNYASEDDRVTVLDELPAGVAALTDAEKGFLHVLADVLAATEWAEGPLQAATYDAARRTPIPQPTAFRAFYQALLGRDAGPRAGPLLSVLEPGFVLGRLREVDYSESGFLVATAITPPAFEEWVRENGGKIESAAATLRAHPVGCLDVDFRLSDGKTERKRMLSESLPDDPSAAHAYLDGLAREHGFTITSE
jgi:lysyl-tRNA synthetase class 1